MNSSSGGMMWRRAAVLVVLCLALAIAITGALFARAPLIARSWDRESLRPPTERDLAEAEDCARLDWRPALRLLGADRDVRCGELVLIGRVSTLLDGHPNRREWARSRLARLPSAIRLRWALALHQSGETPVALSRLTRSGQVPPARVAPWIAALAAEETLPTWTDPALQTRIAVYRLESAPYPAFDDVRLARRTALALPGEGPNTTRIAFNTLGIELGVVWGDAISGAPLDAVPAPWVTTLSRRIRDCTVPYDPRCLDLVLDLAEEELANEGPDRPEVAAPPPSAAAPLWELLHPSAELQAIAEEEVASWRAWADTNGVQAVRATLLDGRTADRELQLARAGDPLAALHLGGSTPWATALAVTLLVPDARASETAQGAALLLDGEMWLLPRCGAFDRAPPGSQPAAQLDSAGLVARAALELAAAASRTGRRVTAHQAATLALRIDPASRPAAAGIDAMLAPAMDAASNAGRQAGALFGIRSASEDPLEPGELRDPCL